MKKRPYQSPVRQRQADDTRARIAAAARKLLEEHGYAGMTMPAIAKKAGVAVATVYAVFGSKTGILSEILDAARFDESYQNLVREAMHTSDPRERLRFPARIARRIYESEHSVLDLLRGAGTVAPTLARSEAERECTRYDAQAGMIQFLVRSRTLRPGLDPQHARDILWSLTSRDLYRLLVRERGWTAQQYEDWLADTLVEALVRPAVVRRDVHPDLRPDPSRKR
jgi:AcrR family transcriptional regulator